ncbi:MAG: tape measure protein [Alcanivorax jadensis]|uniref:tape measure protein n=1 Tax=Alcanivorax jadensis TaxID=64988 RepID=UPI0030032A37
MALREIIQASDAYTSLNSRLLLVSDSQEEANATFKDAYQLAQETRQELGSTVELYARLARSTEELNLTDEERLAITRAINQSYVVSGASAQEAASSTLQLSQGLAAGALRGEELNSVLENSPRLARAIADGLGITIGELRKYGEEGKLTAEAVSRALLRSADDINSEFQQMPRTVGQAMQQLRNDLVVTFGQTDTSGFVDAIDDLRGLVTDPGFQEGVVALGTAVATLARWLGEATTEGIKFTKWASEELAARYEGVAGDDVVRLQQQADKIRETLESGGILNTADRIRFFGDDGWIEWWSEDELKASLAEIEKQLADARERNANPLTGGKSEKSGSGSGGGDKTPINTGPDKEAEKRLKEQQKFVDQLEREAELYDASESAARQYEIAQLGLTGSLLERAKAADAALAELERLKEADEDAAALEGIEIQLLDAQGNGIEARGRELEAKFSELMERLEARGDEAGQELVRKLIDVEKMQAGLDDFQERLSEVTKMATSQRDLLSSQFEAGLISQPEYREGLMDIDSNAVSQLEQMRDAAVEYAQAMGDPTILQNFDAMVLGYQRVNDQTQRFLADGQQINEMLSTGLSDALLNVADGTQSAGEAFRQFAADFLRQLAQMILKQMIFNAISGATGAGGIGGAVAGAAAGAFADGGYTGPGGKYQPAGVVHRGEYVQPQEALREPGALEFMHAFRREGMRSLARFQGYADGGLVGASPTISDSPAALMGQAVPKADLHQRLLPILDDDLIAGAMKGPAGEQILELHISRNPSKFRSLLNGGS